jgi:hypothetical protein
MQRMRSMAKSTQKKIDPNLQYCQICYCSLKDSYLVKIHQKTHRENQNVSTLKRSLMNELRLQKIYNHFNNEGKFLTIQTILNNLKNQNHVLYKNFKLLQNANLEMFNNFKNKSKFPCINCGECFKNNFELSVHYRNKQCVEDSEKTCSFCLKINTRDHRTYHNIECVACGVTVGGLIYHLKTIDHTPYITHSTTV